MRKLGLLPLHLPLILLLFSLLPVPSCSLIIDVPANCDQVANCGEYVCNQENTECLFLCQHNDHCAQGHRCDMSSQRCIKNPCLADETRLVLEKTEDLISWNAEAGTDRFLLAIAEPTRLGAWVFDTSGASIAANIELDRDAKQLSTPSIAQNNSQFVIIWSDKTDTHTRLRFGIVDFAGTQTVPTRSLIEFDHSRDISFPACTFDGENLLIVFSSQVEGQTDLFFAKISMNGGPPEELLTEDNLSRITNTTPASKHPQIAVGPFTYSIIRQETHTPQKQELWLRNVDREGNPVGGNIGIARGDIEVFESDLALWEESMVIAWTERKENQTRGWLQLVNKTGDFVEDRIEVSSIIDDISVISLSVKAHKAALGIIGYQDGVPDIFLSMVDLNLKNSASFSLNTNPVNPSSLTLLPGPSEGYLLVWHDTESLPPGFWFSSLQCE